MTAPSSPGHSLSDIARQLADQKLPPVERWNPPYCGRIDMRIARDGTWYYLGTPIGRPAMVKLFSSVLRLEQDGSFVLVTPVEKLGITVEDAPFQAVELLTSGHGRGRSLAFRLNTDEHVLVDGGHRLRVMVDSATEEPRPYVHVRRGLEALIRRPVFYEMVELALVEQGGDAPLGLWSAGLFFTLDGSGAA